MLLQLSAVVEVPDNFVSEARKWEHHVDRLFDLDNYPEIKSVSDVKVKPKQEAIIIEKNEWSDSDFAAFCKLFGVPVDTEMISVENLTISTYPKIETDTKIKQIDSFGENKRSD